MGWFYRHLIRPALFTQDPEAVHGRTVRALARASRHPLLRDALESFFAAPELPVELFGLRFPNPVGLAAGMDKDAEALPAWQALGFGFTELGAVTWHRQPGNPSPRLFRAVPEQAIVNRMGFNNVGAETVAQRLAQWRSRQLWPNHPVGINLGKSKVTPLEKAAADYADSYRVLRPHADFFVINVSSPNTPDLRRLQDKAALEDILAAIAEVESSSGTRGGELELRSPKGNSPPTPGARAGKPVLVKVAPDLSFEALDEILELARPHQIGGIVATNTTIARPSSANAQAQRAYAETGGLSGRPLRERSTEIVRHVFRQTRGRLPVIGVGGIFDAADAWDKVTAGASLIQIYTGLVYEGPGAARAIVDGLRERLGQRALKDLRQAVGICAG